MSSQSLSPPRRSAAGCGKATGSLPVFPVPSPHSAGRWTAAPPPAAPAAAVTVTVKRQFHFEHLEGEVQLYFIGEWDLPERPCRPAEIPSRCTEL